MKGMKCTQVRLVNSLWGKILFCVHTAVSHWCKFLFIRLFLSTASVVVLSCCCCIALLWWTGQDGRWGGDERDYWRRTWWRGCHGDEGRTCSVSSVPHSDGGDLWRDGKMGGEEECSTTCCCWTWHTESASAGGALWWPAAFSTHAAERKTRMLTITLERGRNESGRVFTAVTSSASHLLRSPLVAQRPELIWVGDTDFMQRSQVPWQVCPKVLCGFWEVRDILQTQWKWKI